MNKWDVYKILGSIWLSTFLVGVALFMYVWACRAHDMALIRELIRNSGNNSNQVHIDRQWTEQDTVREIANKILRDRQDADMRRTPSSD